MDANAAAEKHVAIPAVDWEVGKWHLDPGAVSRRALRRTPSEYQSAIPASIATLDLQLPSGLAADVHDATTAMARLDAYVSAKFGTTALAPMQTVLMRSESASSSEIEYLTVGARQLAIAQLGGQASHNATLVAKNVAAMDAAIRLAGDLSLQTIMEMHDALLGGEHREAGKLRVGQVWIGTGTSTPPTADYVPPKAERVEPALQDLLSFVNRTDLPVLPQAAVAHAQFETIHPFSDGNGRVGRALIQAMFRNQGLTQHITIPISAGLLVDTGWYVDALNAYRIGEAGPIVATLARAAQLAAGNGHWLVDSLWELLGEWETRIRTRVGSGARLALPAILGQPAVNLQFLVRRVGLSESAASRALQALEESGILKSTSDKKRNRVWVAPEAIKVMDSFANRLGRRTGH
ncbi:MAG: Fic family protein [Propionibacteriaceae bacterium]|jgi:Fic family protein|nr:Fic family protein [Propionibacteriaceae bacterium]